MEIAIIGAGLAGLVLARGLSDNHRVTVFEKARGSGGRMSTRRADPFVFDHGAQYFTAESDEFKAFIADLNQHGQVAIWPETLALKEGARVSGKTRYIAAPGMNSICKKLSRRMNVRTKSHIEHVTGEAGQWYLESRDGDRFGPFDWVVSTAPAPQTPTLMPAEFAGQATLSGVGMSGCFALMLGFDTPIDVPWQALKSATPPVGWMASGQSKPGRSEVSTLLVQSTNTWADQHLEDAPDAVMSALLEHGTALAGIDLSRATHQVLHRWRYAATPNPAGVPFLLDDHRQLAACGDWCLGSKVEAAFLSATALSAALHSATGS